MFFEKYYYFFNSGVILFDERYNVSLQVFELFVQFRFWVGSDDTPSVLRFLFFGWETMMRLPFCG